MLIFTAIECLSAQMCHLDKCEALIFENIYLFGVMSKSRPLKAYFFGLQDFCFSTALRGKLWWASYNVSNRKPFPACLPHTPY